jgi:pimeloyl-ACP methyl ester carboxylesterase
VDGQKIASLAELAGHGDTSGQDQIVVTFNKPLERRTGREVLEYTFRMMMSYQPRQDLPGDLLAFAQPLLVMAGSKDESFVAEGYEPTIAPYAKGMFKVLPGLSHFGLVVRPQGAEEVDLWLRRLG